MTTGAANVGAGALRFGLDETAVPFLLLFAFVWVLSGAYAWVTLPRGERARLFAWYVAAGVGGVAVALARDAVAFYGCFALMALPSWGLVTHDRTDASRRAGVVYLALTVLGEALLLGGMMLLAARAGSLDLAALRAAAASEPLALGMVVGSIGLKIGALPASGVLPLMYVHAPAGAASALAGASVKVGALAMLRLLPFGADLAHWQTALVVLGLATAFGAAILGVLTTSTRAVLGYSSASQMGLITIAAGMGMGSPGAATLASGAVVAYSIHHGLAKSALVLGDDVVSRLNGRARTAALAALALPALALVGAPLTSGFVAKYALKDAVHAVAGPLGHTIEALLPWAAVGTAALMLRFFALIRARGAGHAAATRSGVRPAVALWSVLLVAVALASWLWPTGWADHAMEGAFDPASLWPAVWPALLALVVGMTAGRAIRSERLRRGVVAPGDLLALMGEAASQSVDRPTRAYVPRARTNAHPVAAIAAWAAGREARLLTWPVASAVFVAIVIVVVLIAWG